MYFQWFERKVTYLGENIGISSQRLGCKYSGVCEGWMGEVGVQVEEHEQLKEREKTVGGSVVVKLSGDKGRQEGKQMQV